MAKKKKKAKRKRPLPAAAKSLKLAKLRGKVIEPILELPYVSVSRLLTFVECHRKYYWNYIRNMTPRELSIPFFVGKIHHKAMEWFYGNVKPKTILKRLPEEIAQYLDGRFIPPDKVGDVEMQKAMVQGMVGGYMEMHADEPKEWDVVMLENTFELTLPDGTKFRGVLDMLYRKAVGRSKKTKLWIGEHKALSAMTRDFIDRLPLDLQAQCYPMLVERCLDETLTGICYNVAVKSRLRQKQNERFDEFISRVKEGYKIAPEKYFQREDLLFSKKYSAAALCDLIAITTELRAHYAQTNDEKLNPDCWYRNSRACFNYNSRCPYYRLCRYGDRSDQLTLFEGREHRPDGEIIREKDATPKEERPKGRKPVRRKRRRAKA